ncbi:MAG: acetyltransferase [Firmicutes bacterium HGW-Firmicutes-5]|nr:MAG: acetyltransferase [Firmicutes bacterium HGW-Firmicutes-5]
MKEKLIIIGASGHGKVVADIAMKMNKWKNISFFDDNKSLKSALGLNISGKSADAFIHINEADIFVAIGNNESREQLQDQLEANGSKLPVLIHPNAVIGPDVELGDGTVIMAGVVINTSSRIGKGCIINTSATVDHDNVIEDYVHVSPGANLAGIVKIGIRSWIGIGSVVSNNLSITNDCKVGAGAVVVKDIEEPGTYVGIPAKRIK